ncbi:hypothetical protein H4R34_003294 [Dimargaris verticillata]|uniref:Synergin gamma C-terminal domain-containing protein n=1 Tax=Dimargaris verticillata TaxID=2761393 RepID=A0A9W8EC56_9FUNG|nr:hypothetical protein H4R34_003294 [Dimargaris verticillata]
MDTWAAGLGKAKSQLQETVGFLLELQSYKLTSQQLSQLLKDHSRVCLLLQGTIEIHAFAQRVHQAVIAHKNSLCPEAVVDIITQYAACQRAFDQLRDWLQEHKDCLGSALADQCAAPCSDHQLSQCGFCLQGIFQRTKGLGLMSAGLVHYAGSDYHAGCINFWLRNCASL